MAGDKQAFAELIERHKNVVYSLAHHMVRDASEAEDVAQEAFVKAYMSLANFRRECSFRNWLCRITTRLCIDHLRAQKPERQWVLKGETPQYAAAAEPEPAEVLATREELALALNKIPAHLRAAVVLRHLEELSYQEMTEILRLPLGTVKTHIRRGRAALKKELENLRKEEMQVRHRLEEI